MTASTLVDTLIIDGMSKSFTGASGRVDALENISISVSRGQFVTFIGPSGCGKSTLLGVVAGLISADAGRVSIFGEDVSQAVAAKHIGYVPQSPALLPWRTVLDNVRLPLQVNRRVTNGSRTHRDPVALLGSFGLGGALRLHPSELSGGMQQRVAIARAMVFNPTILLMDEPFSALDELTREQQRQQLLTFWESNRTTVLFVTHSVAEAVALSDLVVVMEARPGRVRALVPIRIPRPRPALLETTKEFHDLENEVRAELRGAWHGD